MNEEYLASVACWLPCKEFNCIFIFFLSPWVYEESVQVIENADVIKSAPTDVGVENLEE